MARAKTKTLTSVACIPRKTRNAHDGNYREPNHDPSDPKPSEDDGGDNNDDNPDDGVDDNDPDDRADDDPPENPPPCHGTGRGAAHGRG